MKSRISFIIALVLILTLSIISFAEMGIEEIKASMAKDMKFEVNGEMWQPEDVDGSPLYPIIYKGRSYVPVRSLLEDRDVDVDYDADRRTIMLNDPIDPDNEWEDEDDKSEPPKDSKYWDPDGDKNPDIGDIIAGPIIWQIGGPYEELPDYTLLLEEFEKLNSIMDETTVTLNLDREAKVIINGKEWKIEELIKEKKSFAVSGDLDGKISFKGDKGKDTINLVEFDGKEIGEEAAAQKIKVEVTFSGPPLKIKIVVTF